MKTNETHTPGPWAAFGPDEDCPDRKWSIEHERGPMLGYRKIATLHGEAEANARLIAASPDMLAALKGIESALNELLFERRLDSTLPEFYQVREARNAARDAIAKATGGAS